MTDSFDLDALTGRAAGLVEAARAAGADAADAVVALSRARSATVRQGKVEETDSAESADLGLRVFVGRRSALVTASFADRPADLAERAVAMARVAPEDPYAGLADEALLATERPDLDLHDAAEPDMEALVEAAHRIEHAMFEVPGVTRSGGSSASAGAGGIVLVTSHGFSGGYLRTSHSLSATAIAGDGTRMERDYWYRAKTHAADLPDPQEIGRTAGERAVRRLEPKKLTTRRVPVVYEPRAAAGFIGHFLSAINGAAVARRTSFLRTRMGERIFPESVTITDDPFVKRGAASSPFDGEGVAGGPLELVSAGRLAAWTLDSATARELGLRTNGRARRGLGAPAPGATNVAVAPGTLEPDDFLREIGTGLYVTDLIGQGVNLVTGDYSRGAAGFWIEDGQIEYPVSEITVAGRLEDMFASLLLANDVTEFGAIRVPTIAVEGVTVGGR